ncbi:MAG: S9 family peptidase [Bacteroides sp.]|nr:S9 family peptidase [Bacteroides sp.]
MKKTSVLLYLLLSLNMIAGTMAQDLRELTLEDVIPGGSTYRFTENLYNLQWWGETCIHSEYDVVYQIDPHTGEQSVLFSSEDKEMLDEKALQEGIHLSGLSQVRFPWAGLPRMLLTGRKDNEKVYLVYDFEKQKLISPLIFDAKAGDTDYHPASHQLAYTVDNNLYIALEGQTLRITDEPEGIVCGQAVHRHEFGIRKGTFWSPQGDRLAFYHMDESMVTEYPLVDTRGRIAEERPVRYPMAGMNSHTVSIGIYDLFSTTTVYLQTGDPTDRYFTNITWSPDGKEIYLIEVNRDQNHAQLCRYDAKTGVLQAVLLEEKHPNYVEPQHPIVFLPWNEKQFIYQSQRDGFNHLYLYDTTGKLVRQLTSGNWLVQEMSGFLPKRKEVVILSTEYSPLQSNVFAVSTANGKRRPIGYAEGKHRVLLSRSGEFLTDEYATPEIPRYIDILSTATGRSQATRILTAGNPFEGFRLPSLETGTLTAADGITELYYRLVKPADFDPSHKYPVIIYVYGGPHAQMIGNGFLYDVRGWDLYMANQGYILFTLDNRGSENRGLEFENCTFRRLGIEEGKDQVKGVEFLSSLPYVDENRIGVHGWSFGGHMTTALMLRYPKLFKVGVAGGPVIDWKYYEIMYGERYMDHPDDNPEGYELCNLNNLAGNLEGKLMLVHDDQDDVCVPQHTFSFLTACIEARTYPDLIIYPNHGHNVRGRDRVHLYEKITRYFKENL